MLKSIHRHILNASIYFLFLCTINVQAEEKVTVFAAASLTNAMTDIVRHYEQLQTNQPSVTIKTSFAASSILAKQIENGAPVDIFISADLKWMRYLEDKNLIQTENQVNLLGNQLVLIAPKGKSFAVQMDKNFNFAGAFSGKLCTGETESVPAGIYAKQSLKSLNWWDPIKLRIVGTQDVRAALVFVARGECDAGIVYASDAKISNQVEIIASFPVSSHEAIIYPFARTKNEKNAAASNFYHYLSSDYAKSIFKQYGFTILAK